MPFLVFAALLLLLPLLFTQVLATALLKLHISAEIAALLVIAIFMGGLVNIPVKRIVRTEEVVYHPFAIFGLFGLFPQWERVRRETVIAVNLGGCVIPTALAAYEILYVVTQGWQVTGALCLAVIMNTAVCFWIAKPVRGIGIAMPGLIPPVVAVLCAIVFAPDQSAPVAFVSGVLGPLVGADLMNLREIPRISTGMASIGGAGTFDGIVLSGIFAAYLA